jgi:predicted Zn-dependent protease
LAALALARAGDIDHAQTLAQEVRKQKPLSTELNGYWLPAIEGSIAIQRKNPSKAIELLQATAPHELGNPTPQFALSATFYPIYVRGQAYLASHQGAEATAEFQKFIDHRSIVMNYPLTALAHLGLARAYAMQGETTKARAAYQDFLTLWKDADPDIPVLQQAKDEAAALP